MLPEIQSAIDLAPLTTLGVPCRAAFFAAPSTSAGVVAALDWARARQLPVWILGGGSNVVFTADFPGLVLQPALRGRAKVGETAHDHLVRLGAGENWHDAVAWSLAQGWPGLENLALIPGSVGAAPVQNIGAYGLELVDRFHSLEAWDRTLGTCVTLDRAACRFGYRDSVFKHDGGARYIVLAVTLALPRRWQALTRYRDVEQALGAQGIHTPDPQTVFETVVAIRRRKLPDPAQIGNVGSFFKNPLVTPEVYDRLRVQAPDLVAYPQTDGYFKLAAGWLIDQCGWKGRTLGRAGVHASQALVLTNLGGACGDEIVGLAARIAQDVKTRFGIDLEPEPLIVGPSPWRPVPATHLGTLL